MNHYKSFVNGQNSMILNSTDKNDDFSGYVLGFCCVNRTYVLNFKCL